jgi:hypothetical protein
MFLLRTEKGVVILEYHHFASISEITELDIDLQSMLMAQEEGQPDYVSLLDGGI